MSFEWCDRCGNPRLDTGELVVMVGLKPGRAWRTTGYPMFRIDADGDVSIESDAHGTAELVETDVPDVRRVCRCAEVQGA